MNNILIIDDDKCITSLYRAKLESEGYQTEVCHDGQEAMRLLRFLVPDLVVLDVMLPGADGADVLAFIRSQETTGALPVIVLTNACSYASDQVLATCKEGADRCLIKANCTPDLLLAEVRSVLAAARQSFVPANPNPA